MRPPSSTLASPHARHPALAAPDRAPHGAAGLRERQGLSQATVARRLSKHQSFVSKYESGERRLSVIEFIDVVRALGGEPAAVLRRFIPAIDGAGP